MLLHIWASSTGVTLWQFNLTENWDSKASNVHTEMLEWQVSGQYAGWPLVPQNEKN